MSDARAYAKRLIYSPRLWAEIRAALQRQESEIALAVGFWAVERAETLRKQRAERRAA